MVGLQWFGNLITAFRPAEQIHILAAFAAEGEQGRFQSQVCGQFLLADGAGLRSDHGSVLLLDAVGKFHPAERLQQAAAGGMLQLFNRG